MEEKGKYIYSIIETNNPRKFEFVGMGGGKVYTISDGNLSAVVSDSPMKVYMMTREDLMLHQRILEEIMRKEGDILPVSFGTVAGSADAVSELLRSKAKELHEAFLNVAGKMELNLKVLWKDMDRVFQEIVEENEIIKRAKFASKKRALGRFEAARIGEIVKNALDGKRAILAQKIISQLRPLASQALDGSILNDAMICNAMFLMPRDQGKVYDQRVLELAQTYGDALNFIHIGPLPPFNFVNVKISLGL